MKSLFDWFLNYPIFMWIFKLTDKLFKPKFTIWSRVFSRKDMVKATGDKNIRFKQGFP